MYKVGTAFWIGLFLSGFGFVVTIIGIAGADFTKSEAVDTAVWPLHRVAVAGSEPDAGPLSFARPQADAPGSLARISVAGSLIT